MNDKVWWHSKTLWVMGVTFIVSLIAGITGQEWNGEEIVAMVISGIGIILRIVTKGAVNWT